MAAEDREATAVAAADRLWELAGGAAAGSDAQLQFVKSFALLARSAGQLDTVAGLLDGSRDAGGADRGPDLRWELLTSLVAGGRAGQAEIDAELERDNTATGQHAAALAKAAIPTAGGEGGGLGRRSWSRATCPTPLQRRRDRRLHPRARHGPAGALRGRSTSTPSPGIVGHAARHELAQQIVVGLYPSQLTTPGDAWTPRMSSWTGWRSDSPALRRMVLESRDGVVRALRAQAADR